MKISALHKKKLVSEIKFVVGKMKSEKDPQKKIYYFSALHGALARIFNIEFDSDLVFAHMVTNATYNTFNLRLVTPDKVIEIPPEIFEKLTEVTEEFKNAIEKNKNLYEVLKKFVLLGFVTSGNGYYLYQRKLLKI